MEVRNLEDTRETSALRERALQAPPPDAKAKRPRRVPTGNVLSDAGFDV
jgi:hypothetical protein